MGAATLSSPSQQPAARRLASGWPLVVAGCLALAALSLLWARQTTYDPTAWLIWGREIVHGRLSTTGGPSWKPLPIAITAPGALLGDTAQQQVWLVVARAGGLVALAMAFRLAWRLEGPVAGAIAAAALLISSKFASHVFRGQSEGLLAALALGAVEAHLVGRRRLAFALLVATGLLRPEMLAFVGLYGLWLASSAPAGVARRRTLAVVIAAGAVIVALWLVPEKIGSGELLRAASRAREPVADSPAQASRPFVATFSNAAPVLPWPLYACGVALVLAALAQARRTRRPSLVLALAAIATALMVIVAVMAEAGFTGNARYLTIPIALTCVIGGAGAVFLYRLARARLSTRAAAAAIALGIAIAAPFAVHIALRACDDMRGALRESAAYAALPDAIARAGGHAAVERCRPLYAAWYDTQAVAHALHVHQDDVAIDPRPPGTIFARRGSGLSRDRRFRVLAATGHWVIASSCARAR